MDLGAVVVAVAGAVSAIAGNPVFANVNGAAIVKKAAPFFCLFWADQLGGGILGDGPHGGCPTFCVLLREERMVVASEDVGSRQLIDPPITDFWYFWRARCQTLDRRRRCVERLSHERQQGLLVKRFGKKWEVPPAYAVPC